jgi:hypothetical protein
MIDEHAGQAGTFMVDPIKGIRIPIEQYEKEQAEIAKAAELKPDIKEKL